MTLRQTAYHEAGHAMASLRFALTVERVSILPDASAETLGHSQDLYVDDEHLERDEAGRLTITPDPRAFKAHIVGLYAGRAAEALLADERDPWRAFRGLAGDGSDRRQAAERVATLWPSFGERRRRMRRYRRLALWLAWRYRARIERLAEALLRFGTLEDVEVELAIEEGAESIAAYRAMWTRHDGGRWAEWAAAVAQLRAGEAGAERAQDGHKREA